jgi:hypothetical protein
MLYGMSDGTTMCGQPVSNETVKTGSRGQANCETPQIRTAGRAMHAIGYRRHAGPR